MDTIRTIKLSGPLAQFGHVHRMAVSNVAEAIRALCVTRPGFEKYLMEAKDKGIAFAVMVGKKNVGVDDLRNPVGSDEIRLVPVIMGSKKAGVLQIIVGVVLIAIGAFVQWWMGGAPNPVSNYLYGAGISMIIGGVIQLLTPQPKMNKDERRDNQTSYTFNGAVNVQAQGNPIPVLYGEMYTGSVVVSAGINAQEHYVVPTNLTSGGGAYRGGGSMAGDVIDRARSNVQ